MKELNKRKIIDTNLNEIKNEKLRDYTGEFELVGSLKIGDDIRQTHSTFRNVDDFESYIHSIDQDYNSKDALFNGYIYKLDTPQFN